MTSPPASRRVGLIGYPLRHSISPVFQQAAFDALGLTVRYESWETPADALPEVLSGLRRQHILGANVTIPYKKSVLRYLDRVDEVARSIGAVNTIVNHAGELRGSNTDVRGFADALRLDGQVDPKGRRVTVLGAGGAARAVLASLVSSGAARVTVAARRIDQADALIADLAVKLGSVQATLLDTVPLDASSKALASAIAASNVLVNATPVGTTHRDDPDRSPVDVTLLHERLLVCDLVYNPPETPLLRSARERGARILNGLPMLVYQGAESFRLWTGRNAPIELMRAKALEALGG